MIALICCSHVPGVPSRSSHHVKTEISTGSDFNLGFWFPIVVPNGGTKLAVSVWHPQRLRGDVLLGADYIDVSETPLSSVTDGFMGMRYVQLYAPFELAASGTRAGSHAATGTTWTGSLLLAIQMREEVSDLVMLSHDLPCSPPPWSSHASSPPLLGLPTPPLPLSAPARGLPAPTHMFDPVRCM